MMQFDFNNKNVLITGGSRGIGRACAQLFADAGATVIFTYKSNKEEADKTLSLLKKEGGHGCYQMDIANAGEVKNVFESIIDKYKKIDVLVNNAGVFLEHKIAEVSYDEWQESWHQTINTNLVGVSNLYYFTSKNMMKNGGGKIVNISSRGAFRGEPDHPAYGASKAGLNAMSQSLAVALAPYNISIGIIAPGFVETDMASGYLNSEEGAAIKKQSPFDRVATADEVARLVAVFASEGLEFSTGSIVDLNGASYLRS